jgi:5-methyltetrahydropteroyltriglutamate--homocysteine methyltransferase
MQRSTERILTTHVGSLPRPAELVELDMAKRAGRPYDEQARHAQLRSGVSAVVRLQQQAGIDVVNEGEFGKAVRASIDYGPWASYINERLAGWVAYEPGTPDVSSSGVELLVQRGAQRRERDVFVDFYRDEPALTGPATPQQQMRFTAPVVYVGQALLERDLANLSAALQAVSTTEAFVTSVAPGSFGRAGNRYYRTEEEYLFALAEAMRTEYAAIVDAGFILQADDPGLAENWDAMDPAVDLPSYQRFAQICVEALNHALRDIPEDRVRYHVCWGSWHGPHTTDVPLRDIAEVMLRVKAQAYSVEAGNVRHEHEWKVWQDIRLPEGKVLVPGVVSHATNVVEHPEVVADRILRYAQVVGSENVIASTDCGLGGRIHPSLAWAKLRTLSEGAALASRQLRGNPVSVTGALAV